MNLNTKTLVGTKVITQSGMAVGKLASLELDGDTGRVTALKVRTRGMVPGLLDNELIVAWSQVVSMSEKEIVVVDNLSRANAVLAKKDFAAPPAQLKEQAT